MLFRDEAEQMDLRREPQFGDLAPEGRAQHTLSPDEQLHVSPILTQ